MSVIQVMLATDCGLTLDVFGDDDPEDCDCDDLPGRFPCWICVRNGRRDLPEGNE